MRYRTLNPKPKSKLNHAVTSAGGGSYFYRNAPFTVAVGAVGAAIIFSSAVASGADPTDEQAKAGFARAQGFMQSIKTPVQVREFGRHAGIVGVAEDLCHRERAFWFRVVGVNARKLEPKAFFEGHAEGVMFMSKLKSSKPSAAICEVTLALYGIGGSAVDGALE
jgi:hypothetical protein